jgi:hypothetical protein
VAFANTNKLLSFPATTNTVIAFIAQLFLDNCAPATISSIISAVAYVHKMFHSSDPTTGFVIRKMLQGATKLRKLPDSRMPITKDILLKLVNSTILHITLEFCFAQCLLLPFMCF